MVTDVQGLEGQLLLLRLACSANSHARHVVIHRCQYDGSLWPPFDVTLASQDGVSVSGAFITHVNAAARQLGIRVGDQVHLPRNSYFSVIVSLFSLC